MIADKPVDIEEMARLFNVSEGTVSNWVDSGMPVLRPSPRVLRFIVTDCVEWMKTDRVAQ